MPSHNERKIGELVLSLMAHYWTADDDTAIRKLQALDWVDDLDEFDPHIVAEACKLWRRANNKRPTPHDIRALARAEIAYRKPQIERQLTHEELDEIVQRQIMLAEHTKSQKRQQLIAAAYRWTFNLGKPMQPGLKEDDPQVINLVADYKAAMSMC